MAEGRNLRQVGDRIEGLLDELRTGSDARTWGMAEELVRLLVDLYGAGLESVVSVLREAGPEGEDMLSRLADDPFLSSLLVLHDLHPIPVETRIQLALDKVRPYLGSHAGGIEFLGVDDEGVAHLKLEGSCEGCPSSTLTVQMAVERAIQEAAPEIARLDVEGMAEAKPPGPALLQIQPLGSRDRAEEPAAGGGGWVQLDGISLLPGETRAMEVDGARVLLVSAAGNLYAYRNLCPSCRSGLEDGVVDGMILTCPQCASTYNVRLAGRTDGDSLTYLEALPLLPENGGWKIAIPQEVAP